MKVAIYVRVSTNRQTQAQTIDQQLERLQRHLDSQAESLSADHIFRDDGFSGANLNRPGLDRLRDRVKAGVLDRVLLTSPDRLARNYVHQMVLIEEWERCGCKVEFLDRPMSQDPHDQLLLQIRGAVAEYERVLIAERMRRGRQMKLKAGALLPWTVPPYGYRSAPDHPRDPSGVQIEPAEGAIVQALFARYLHEHGTLLSLAKHLLQLGLPSPRGNPRWSTASDSRLAHQSGLHGQAVYWTEPIPACPHSTVCHPSVGQPGTRAGPYAGRGVEPYRSRAGSGEPGGFRARASEIGAESKAGNAQQQKSQLPVARAGQLRGMPVRLYFANHQRRAAVLCLSLPSAATLFAA